MRWCTVQSTCQGVDKSDQVEAVGIILDDIMEEMTSSSANLPPPSPPVEATSTREISYAGTKCGSYSMVLMAVLVAVFGALW